MKKQILNFILGVGMVCSLTVASEDISRGEDDGERSRQSQITKSKKAQKKHFLEDGSLRGTQAQQYGYPSEDLTGGFGDSAGSGNLQDSRLRNQKNTLESEEEKPPSWIYSVGLLNVYFDDGTLKQGFAALLRGGHFITAAELVFNGADFPKSIYVKMQDDSAKPLICIARLEVAALDSQRGLALLRTLGYADDYCNARDPSFYHKRIYDLYYLDIFAHRVPMEIANRAKAQDVQETLFFPLILKQYSFDVDFVSKEKRLFFFDKDLKHYIFYAYGIEKNSKIKAGEPFFNENGRLIGIYGRTQYYSQPVIIHQNVIKSFLCNLQADFKLDTWDESDCRDFQHNLIENMKGIVKDRTVK